MRSKRRPEILGLYAGGMSVRDISAHLSELYDTQIGRDTISRITDAVLEGRPGRGAPALWSGSTRSSTSTQMFVKVREDHSVKNRACACGLALGVSCDGDREVLGTWWQETEGSRSWLSVLNDLQRRGVQDVLIAETPRPPRRSAHLTA